ncbi:hypothetical protein BO221_18955 [Archangium sp. Cb G35]|uniref:hypothetical protein n=1 Tax=Archangium sp. Cb G35 TaxID=1920190 RepID=UPI0009376CE8|nr:hypothetical protein [Archangium sp. Cb G35]OJT22976.1 hypothetical protein BO221_18955 [Archangium sp. Cb G35]
MSDSSNKSQQFGQPQEETKKNTKVFNLRVKIDPYLKVPAEKKKRQDEKFDPFAVNFSAPKPEDF